MMLPSGLLLLLAISSSSFANGVQKIPRITEHPTDMTVARNDPVTLKCSVDGNPSPIIEWYRDGELIVSSAKVGGAGNSHRVMLPGGDLFFFRVVHGRKESDAGIYWCSARNSQGSARSRNATLTVAYLHPEFRTAPLATRGILGEPTTLECEPPKGHPEPQVRWKKNGQLMDLSPPTGSNGSPLHRDHSARIRVDEIGNLVFAKLTSSDEGRYQCIAQNVVATRETSAVLLSVHVRPLIVRPPQDSTGLLGGDVTLECGVTGDPPPQVEWRRQDGVKIPVGRIRPASTSDPAGRTSLRLERLVASDAGRYVCEVENSVGSTSASAQLVVLVPPTWNSSAGISNGGQAFLPREVRGYIDQSVQLDCPVFGSPPPLVFWQREGQGRLLGASSSSSPAELLTYESSSRSGSVGGRWIVLLNGTLVISRLRREDAGGVWCGAVSEAGSLVARTRLEVITVSSPPPPVIDVGPANQTLPLGSPATLSCSTTEPNSRELPLTWWKDGIQLNATVRMTQSGESGTLRIEDLQLTDAGSYTCKVGEGGRSTAWTASITVASQTNPNVVFSRSPSDPMALPGSPSQPRLLHKSSTSLTIGWQSGSRMGASPLLGYTIEVFSSSPDSLRSSSESWTWAGPAVPLERYWRIVSRRLKSDQLVLTDLQPATSYTFLVRAENGHGLSLPSPISPWFTTLPSGSSSSQQELDEGRQRLSSSLASLRLEPVRSLNASTVRLSWRWLDGVDGSEPADSSVEGLHIWYRPTVGKNSSSSDGGEGSSNLFRVIPTLHSGTSTGSYVLSDLMPSTSYLFFLVPFYRTVDGRPSNSQTLTTLESAPEGPPRDLLVRQLNSSSCLVKWNEPDVRQRNGIITGYQIYVFMDDSSETLLANMTLPPLPTSVIIGNLGTGSSYSIRAAAWTQAGLGPPSEAAVFTMELLSFQPHPNIPTVVDEDVDPYSHFDKRNRGGGVATQVVQETWFILAIGGVLLATLIMLVAALIVRRLWAKNKAMSSVQKVELGSGGNDELHISHSIRSNGHGNRDLLWSRGWVSGSNHSGPGARNTMSTSQKEAELESQKALLPPHGAPPEYAELLNQHGSYPADPSNHHLSLSSFLPRRSNSNSNTTNSSSTVNNNMMMQPCTPSAYATTTLVNPSTRHMAGGGGSSGPYSSKSSTESSTSGSYAVEHRSRKGSGNNNNSFSAHQRIPNWSELLPPPPRHPPPPSPAPNSDRDGSLPASIKPTHKFGSAAPSPALSKRSVPSTSQLYHETGGLVVRVKQPMRRNNQQQQKDVVVRNQQSGIESSNKSSFAVNGYKPSINYHCNPLENITTKWDDEADDDYSRSLGRGTVDDDGNDSSSGTEEMASSVYDNSPVAYRPPRGKQPSPAGISLRSKHLAK